MSDQFVAEIRIFGFNFAPTGWAQCNGQLLAISQNTALFSLVGTFYGGNGQSTFGLPDLQGRVPLHPGQGGGLTERFIGEFAGTDAVTLLTSEIPVHTHAAVAKVTGTQADPTGRLWGNAGTQLPLPNFFAQNLGTAAAMNPVALSLSGGSLPHNNLMPYLVLNYCIALQGVFPSRN